MAQVGVSLVIGAANVGAVAAFIIPSSLTDPSGISGGALSNFTIDSPIDVRTDSAAVVQFDKITLAPGASMGRHAHNGSESVSIASGTATFYDADDPKCTAMRYKRCQASSRFRTTRAYHAQRRSPPLVLYVASVTNRSQEATHRRTRPGNRPFEIVRLLAGHARLQPITAGQFRTLRRKGGAK